MTQHWAPPPQSRGTMQALAHDVGRGFLGRCPACGTGRLFGRFLKVRPACQQCGQAFHHHRADDFPPYVVMFVVGHLCGYGIYLAETRFDDVPLWFHVLVWPTLAIGLSVLLLQPVKGAVVALQYGLGMHGFGSPAPVTMRDGADHPSQLEAVERPSGHGSAAGLQRAR